MTNRFGQGSDCNGSELDDLSCGIPAEPFADVHFIAGGGIHELASELEVLLRLRILVDETVHLELEFVRSMIGPELIDLCDLHAGRVRTRRSSMDRQI
jgi:hypothetical protein